MALLKGKGAMTGVNLIARVYDNGATKDGKSHYIDVQVDARDPRGPEQANLHLKSERQTGQDGVERYNNSAPYSLGQLAEIVKIAGPNKEPLTNQAGEVVGNVYGFKANVKPASRGTGLVVNTKTIEPSEFKVDADTITRQIESMKAVAATRRAAQTAQAQASAGAEQVAEADSVEHAVG